jgi:twitching motility protein PilT
MDLRTNHGTHSVPRLYLSSGVPPMVRLDGSLKTLQASPLNAEKIHKMLHDILSDEQRKILDKEFELDLSIDLDKSARCRVNIFRHERGEAAVFRITV